LDGSSNFNNWKARVIAILEENDLDNYVTIIVEEPTSNVGRASFKRNKAKARRIIYDSVKEHIMLIITPLKTAKECFDSLVKLHETKATNQKRLLKSQLCSLKMEKDEFVNSFFTKISHLKDQLLAIGVSVDDDDLVETVFDGLTSAWEAYLVVVNGREVEPTFERLWHDCLQEESTKIVPSHEENLSLAANTKKGKGKKFFQKSKGKGNLKGKPKYDMSKIICYNFNKPRRYAKDCFNEKRKGRYHASTVEANEEPQNKR
jgi:hypothetical protein